MKNLTKGQKRLLVVLLIVLIFAIYDFVKNKDVYLNFYRKKVTKSEKKVGDTNRAGKTSQMIKRLNYDKDWKSDPFFVKVKLKPIKQVPKRKKVSFSLKAISYSETKAVALINDKIVSVGDYISGYRVEKIEPHRVVLKRGSENKVLILK